MPKRILDIPGIGSLITVERDGERVTLPIAEAVEAHGFVFIAGKGGHLKADPADPDAVFADETRIALEQIRERLEGLRLTFRDVVKATVMLADWHDFEAARWQMNDVYSTYFMPEPPVRLLFGVAHLPGANHVEIEVLAAR
jgi:2-iminobutanoate/2-iminopropanoate deaminase